eukprot:4043346-Pyramimonas_sp.AAC.1
MLQAVVLALNVIGMPPRLHVAPPDVVDHGGHVYETQVLGRLQRAEPAIEHQDAFLRHVLLDGLANLLEAARLALFRVVAGWKESPREALLPVAVRPLLRPLADGNCCPQPAAVGTGISARAPHPPARGWPLHDRLLHFHGSGASLDDVLLASGYPRTLHRLVALPDSPRGERLGNARADLGPRPCARTYTWSPFSNSLVSERLKAIVGVDADDCLVHDDHVVRAADLHQV